MQEQWIYGGDLKEELVEIEKILPAEESKEIAAITHSFSCTALLTLYCC